nr:MAG TPA: hypothetical protein [Caudoviricetes sp.]
MSNISMNGEQAKTIKYSGSTPRALHTPASFLLRGWPPFIILNSLIYNITQHKGLI